MLGLLRKEVRCLVRRDSGQRPAYGVHIVRFADIPDQGTMEHIEPWLDSVPPSVSQSQHAIKALGRFRLDGEPHVREAGCALLEFEARYLAI